MPQIYLLVHFACTLCHDLFLMPKTITTLEREKEKKSIRENKKEEEKKKRIEKERLK